MQTTFIGLFLAAVLPLCVAYAQGTVPTFQHAAGRGSYTLVGRDPAQRRRHDHSDGARSDRRSRSRRRRPPASPSSWTRRPDVPRVLRSPVFSKFAFPPGGDTQYADAMLRATFPEGRRVAYAARQAGGEAGQDRRAAWATATSSRRRRPAASFAVVDIEFLQKELFKQLPKQDGKLVIAVTHNTTYYADGDATVCCSWGTHGVDSATGNSFVLGSYLQPRPRWSRTATCSRSPSNSRSSSTIRCTIRWSTAATSRFRATPSRLGCGPVESQGGCGGTGVGFHLLPARAHQYESQEQHSRVEGIRRHGGRGHLSPAERRAAALVYRRVGRLGSTYSFPDAQALTEPAKPCPARGGRGRSAAGPPKPTVAAVPVSGAPNGHRLIGYWAGYGGPGSTIPLREVSPQWDVIIVAFSTPDQNAPEGTMQFHTPAGLDTEQFKADIA